MVDVEAIKFAVTYQIEPSLHLCIDDDAHCVYESLFGWCGNKPVRQGIRPDCCGQDARAPIRKAHTCISSAIGKPFETDCCLETRLSGFDFPDIRRSVKRMSLMRYPPAILIS